MVQNYKKSLKYPHYIRLRHVSCINFLRKLTVVNNRSQGISSFGQFLSLSNIVFTDINEK